MEARRRAGRGKKERYQVRVAQCQLRGVTGGGQRRQPACESPEEGVIKKRRKEGYQDWGMV